MARHIKLKIADIVFLLIAQKGPGSLRRPDSSYRSFLCQDDPDVILRVQRDSEYDWQRKHARIIFDTQPNWRLYYSRNKYIVKTRQRTMVLEPDFTSGEVYIPKNCDLPAFTYPLGEILMINLLGKRRGVLVHACGVKAQEGQGLLFLGASGAGKSTLANLWKKEKGARLLSDDRIIIRKTNNEFFIYGTPWHGDAKVSSKEKAPLERIFFLKHAERNSLKRLDPLEAVSRLIVCSFPTFWDKEGMASTLSFFSGLAKSMSFYELNFTPDKSVIDFIKGQK